MEYCNKSHVIQTLPFNLTEVTLDDKLTSMNGENYANLVEGNQR